ncbi:nuclear transport factor 2 family protein [Mycolicibacillus parakoreensis]|uniref:Nuclear transport factor 2 family protein n=1 Tax=Mycolicibacillus parakoreensis TaxID=1069221 RepID=A0ABY3U415_9MYCO|nr:nuclear transport factor 2 family protein [Mycolicibacillus parakoreensis]MCV7316267.1 nuclear transport factor 2 family protein [Mycolicibacillus parakoreensis]ULN52516.1 nuclear transport factor 2 family protein [Mycolicibacillus parakoreensis]
MFDEAKFREAIARPRLRQPLPTYLEGNRAGGRVAVLTEDELNAQTEQWFVDLDAKIAFYAEHGLDIAFVAEWAKKYWWSWLMRDMSLNDELYTPDLRYKDPTTFGRIIVGLDEFVRYNFAFLDAIPDWRYDPLPDQVYLDVTPDGETRVVVRYIGSGHFSGTLRFYPYDDSAPAIHGVGTFVQCAAVDRYHFGKDGRMYFGETLFDILDALQSSGVVPGERSPVFKALMGASRVPGMIQAVRRRLPLG